MADIQAKKVDIKSLSNDTGIDEGTLRLIIDGTYVPSYSIPQRIVNEVKKVITPPSTLPERIKEADSIKLIWPLLASDVTYDMPEYIPLYEKLIALLRTELADLSDEEGDLNSLLDYAPFGSAVRTEIIDQIVKLQRARIDDAASQGIDELIEFYREDYQSGVHSYLIEKMLAEVTSFEDTNTILDDVVDERTAEYFLFQEKHTQLLRAEIESLDSTVSYEDVKDLHDAMSPGSDEEILLAERIVRVVSDAETIWEFSDLFDGGSEAEDILAIATINALQDYDDDSDMLETLDNAYNSSSRIGRLLSKKKIQLLQAHAETLTDPEDVESLLGEFESDNPARIPVERRWVIVTEGIEEIKQIIDNNSGRVETLAQEKLSALLQKEIPTMDFNTIDEYENMVDGDTPDRRLFEEKVIRLVETHEDVESITVYGASDLEYKLAKKFESNQAPAITVPVVEEQLSVVDTTQNEEDRSIEKLINSMSSTISELMKKFDSLLDDSPHRVRLYGEASKRLKRKLEGASLQKRELLELVKLFPANSEEVILIVKRLADQYPKPWWMF